uniref:Uncharacterized protein n=1 Tax=Oryza meridionalis TaxID=40149 RepID=A0A0E0F530_9ORYZ
MGINNHGAHRANFSLRLASVLEQRQLNLAYIKDELELLLGRQPGSEGIIKRGQAKHERRRYLHGDSKTAPLGGAGTDHAAVIHYALWQHRSHLTNGLAPAEAASPAAKISTVLLLLLLPLNALSLGRHSLEEGNMWRAEGRRKGEVAAAEEAGAAMARAGTDQEKWEIKGRRRRCLSLLALLARVEDHLLFLERGAPAAALAGAASSLPPRLHHRGGRRGREGGSTGGDSDERACARRDDGSDALGGGGTGGGMGRPSTSASTGSGRREGSRRCHRGGGLPPPALSTLPVEPLPRPPSAPPPPSTSASTGSRRKEGSSRWCTLRAQLPPIAAAAATADSRRRRRHRERRAGRRGGEERQRMGKDQRKRCLVHWSSRARSAHRRNDIIVIPTAVDHRRTNRHANIFFLKSSPKAPKILQDSSTGDGDRLRLPQRWPPSAIADFHFLGEPRINSLHL